MMVTLKPCPFCGSDEALNPREHMSHPTQLTGGEPYSFGCDICGASSGTYTTPELAVNAWNRRAPVEAQAERQGVTDAARFLLDRLGEIEWSGTPEEFWQEWFGHVEPAISRLHSALAAAPQTEGADAFDDKWLGDGDSVHVLPSDLKP
jgi:Lar family restriction alleviation protein